MHIEYRKVPLDELYTVDENGDKVPHELVQSGECIIVKETTRYGYLRCIGSEKTSNLGKLIATSFDDLSSTYKRRFSKYRVRRVQTDDDGNQYEVEMLVDQPLDTDTVVEEYVEPYKFAGE